MFQSSRMTLLAAAGVLLLSGCMVEVRPIDGRDGATSPGQPVAAAQAPHAAATAPDVEAVHAMVAAHPEWIKEALLKDPETLMDVQREVQAKRRREETEKAKIALQENAAAVYSDATDPVVGNPSGQITIVEFFDNECPFCKKEAPSLDQIIRENPDVRVVMKEFPVLGPVSEIAARYALASAKQGKYAAFHNALMASTIPEHQLTEENIKTFAKGVGLDVARLTADAAAPEIQQKINANRALATKLNIHGTPGLIVGGNILPGAVPLDQLKQMIGGKVQS
jgi:protein-disulfide isomerase